MKEVYQLSNLVNLTGEINRPLSKTHRIKYTCYDASQNFIVCGATSGSIYLFQRQPCKFLQLIPNVFGPISHVVISSHEQFVAYSSQKGTILVYVIDLEGNAPPTIFSAYYREMTITQLKWRQNDSQLFVGELKGNVFLVNLNNFLGRNLSNISIHPILFLESPVVQICDFDQLLLVSNYTKCILCNTETEEFKQIGNQPRDGKFGACFVCDIDGSDNESEDMIPNNATMMPMTSMRSPPSKTRIFCARPGARMWECDLDGNVIQTHKFKVALKSCRYASILNPSAPPPIPPNVQTLDQLIDLQSIRKRYIFGHTANAFFMFDIRKSSAVLWNDEFGAIHTIKAFDGDNDECVIVVFTKDNRIFSFRMLRLDQLLNDLIGQRELYREAAQQLLNHSNYFKRKIQNGQFAISSYLTLRAKLESSGTDCTIVDELRTHFDGILNEKTMQDQLAIDRRSVRMENGIYRIRENVNVTMTNANAKYTDDADDSGEADCDDDDSNEPLVLSNRKPNATMNCQQIAAMQLSDDEKILQNLFLIYKSLKWSNLNLVERYADVFDRLDVAGISQLLQRLETVILENDPGVDETEAKRNCSRMFLNYFDETTLFDVDANAFDFVISCFVLVNVVPSKVIVDNNENGHALLCQHCKFPLILNVAPHSLEYKSLGEKIVEFLWCNNQKDRLAHIVSAVPAVLFNKIKLMLGEKFDTNTASTASEFTLNTNDKETIVDLLFACGNQQVLEQCVVEYAWFRSTEFWNKFVERMVRLHAQNQIKCTQCANEQIVDSSHRVAEKLFYSYDYVFNVCANYLNGLSALQLCTKYSRHIPCDAIGKNFYLKCLLQN